MQVILVRIVIFMTALMNMSTVNAAHPGCIPIDKAGYVINKPGLYCLMSDLDTRLNFADHHAENPVINIAVSNVTVDMHNHRIGRGRFFAQHGGNGFAIATGEPELEPSAAARIENVTIRNGRLSGFNVGVFSYAFRRSMPVKTRQVRQTGVHSFAYDKSNIILENLRFDQCDEDIRVQDWVADN